MASRLGGGGAWATWLLVRVDRLDSTRLRLGRRALLVLSSLAAAAESSVGRALLLEGAQVLSLFLVIALSIAWSVIHYLQRTRLWVFQGELALLWWIWIAVVWLVVDRPVVPVPFIVLWLLFAVFGGLALYPARRRHLRRRAPATDVEAT